MNEGGLPVMLPASLNFEFPAQSSCHVSLLNRVKIRNLVNMAGRKFGEDCGWRKKWRELPPLPTHPTIHHTPPSTKMVQRHDTTGTDD
jgi:hypothetical protein